MVRVLIPDPQATASKEDKKEDKKKAQSSKSSKKVRSPLHLGAEYSVDQAADDIQLLIRRSDADTVKGSSGDQLGELWWRVDAEQPLKDEAAVFVTGRSATSVPKDINLRTVSLNLSQKMIDARAVREDHHHLRCGLIDSPIALLCSPRAELPPLPLPR